MKKLLPLMFFALACGEEPTKPVEVFPSALGPIESVKALYEVTYARDTTRLATLVGYEAVASYQDRWKEHPTPKYKPAVLANFSLTIDTVYRQALVRFTHTWPDYHDTAYARARPQTAILYHDSDHWRIARIYDDERRMQ
jgi:hypothetical protein